MAEEKKRKPTTDVEIQCPHCENRLRVKVYKHRVNEPEPPEWDIVAMVELVGEQGELFDSGEEKPDDGQETEVE